jgi:gluconolactonase
MSQSSSRRALCLAAAAGLLSLSGALRGTDIAELVPAGAEVRKVAGGFQFVEGPAYGPQGFLVFSDIPANRIVELLPDGTTRDFLNPSEGANGLEFDAGGRLHACQGGGRRVVRIEVTDGKADGKKVTVLADAYDGKKLNSPNDLALDAAGGVYFTDPRYGGAEPVEQPVMGVYYISAEGKVTRVIDDLQRPNGILVSPNGKRLHVANPDRRELWRYDIEAPGKLAGKTLVFTGDPELDGGGPDGMAHDVQGNIYATYKGIVIIDGEGKLVGRIPVPERPANCTLGGKDGKTLYITARTGLYAIDLKVAGMALAPGAPAAGAAPAVAGAAGTRETKAGTLALKVPEAWKEVGPDGKMRANQFQIPAAAGDAEAGELVVYYFGPGGAGGLAANINRWIGQFDAEGRKVKLTRGKGEKWQYTLADVAGTYQKPVGPPVQGKSKPSPGWRMLAAVLETPEGPYFLKLTGPEKTASGAATAFRAAFGANAKDETEYKLGEGG